jgi:hypothetical protein
MGCGSSTKISPQPSNPPDEDNRNQPNPKIITVRPALEQPVKEADKPGEPAGGDDYPRQPPQDDSDLPKSKVS